MITLLLMQHKLRIASTNNPSVDAWPDVAPAADETMEVKFTMSKKRSYSLQFTGSETEIRDNCIIWHPVVVLEGSFHKGIGRLILDLLTSRMNDLLSDVSRHLSPSDEEVPGNE